jgi:tetratricopeptide (TPR) repeat protein
MMKISQNAWNFFHRAREASYHGDYLHAIEYYDNALSTDPDYASAWHEKGNCLDELGRCEEALACYEEALKRDPHHAETWFHKGLIMKRFGRENEAYGCFNQGIERMSGEIGPVKPFSPVLNRILPQLSRFIRVLLLPALRIVHRGSRNASDVPSWSSGT